MNLPFLTADLPGTGGTLRTVDEDFIVDEIPAYAPSGSGDHVFVRIEKRDATTMFAVTAIAKALGIRDRDIGVAGMKDRHAVTTQWLSLPPPVTPERALAVGHPNLRVLEAIRHPHKLRTGHLRGNRFRLTVRGVTPDAVARATAILDVLARAPGAPNWYGEQRFGRDGDNAARGREILATGELPRDPRNAAHPERKLARLLVSSLQSELFNRWLIERIADGLYRTALDGDLMHKLAAGMFECTDPATDTARIANGEIVPTGPMFGVDMRAPKGEAAAREARVLEAAGLTRESFATVRQIAEGTRRDAAIAVADVTVGGSGETLEVGFALPSGAYATAVLREIMKPVAPASDPGPES